MKCPLPIYKASMAMKELGPGDVLEILCTDPGSLSDFPAFARVGKHEFLSGKEVDGQQTFLIRKG